MRRTLSRPTLEDLRARRDEILSIAAAHGATNVRIFGSVARGDADASSDVDLLVDVVVDASGFAYFGLMENLRRELTELLGRDIDVLKNRRPCIAAERILRETIPL